MIATIVSFVLRLCLIGALWAFIWRSMEPRTQGMRILRATLLVLGLICVLALIRVTNP
jgi:hypothetical protein